MYVSIPSTGEHYEEEIAPPTDAEIEEHGWLDAITALAEAGYFAPPQCAECGQDTPDTGWVEYDGRTFCDDAIGSCYDRYKLAAEARYLSKVQGTEGAQ